jgi:hypothetical protein
MEWFVIEVAPDRHPSVTQEHGQDEPSMKSADFTEQPQNFAAAHKRLPGGSRWVMAAMPRLCATGTS